MSRRSSASLLSGVKATGVARVLAQRVESLVGERVDGALAGLAGLLAGVEVAEVREPLGLGVVLALAGPGEHPAALRHAQQVVRAGAVAADEAEDLDGEEAEFGGGHVTDRLLA